MTRTGSGQSSSNAMRLLYASISIASVVLIVVSVVRSNRYNNTSNFSPYAAPVPSPGPSQAPIPGAVHVPSPSVPCKLRRLARRPRPWAHGAGPKPSPGGCADSADDSDGDLGDSNDWSITRRTRRPRRTRHPTRRPEATLSFLTSVNSPVFGMPHIQPSRPAMSMINPFSPHEIGDFAFLMPMLDGDVGNPSHSDGNGVVSTMSMRSTKNDITSSHSDGYLDDVGFD
jgi:hypothetical protein